MGHYKMTSISLEDQISAAINGKTAGGSLYNYDATKAGAKRRKAPKKDFIPKPASDPLVLMAGCPGCGAKCDCMTRKQVAPKTPDSPAPAPVLAGKRRPMSEAAKQKCKAGAAVSPWILHVKAYAKQHNVPYTIALKDAGKTYKKKE